MNDYTKAMNFGYPDAIPVSAWALPATWNKYRDELEGIVARHPDVFGRYVKGTHDYDSMMETYRSGEHIDAWGCIWSNVHEGMEAIVTRHPVPTREDVHRLKVPDKDIGTPHGFMYLRLADLRGFEELMVDFAEEPPELQLLIDKVLEYNLRQIGLKLQQTDSAILDFGDDLGMQHSLPISPDKWRKYLKPCYRRLYSLCHQHNRSVYMHSDGQIYHIIPDLIECGVNIINPQYRANGIDNLVQVCKGKVCVDLDLDRQMFPFCTAADIDEHVREAAMKLGSRQGGLMLKAEFGPDNPLENIEAVCCALEKYRLYYS